MKEMEDSIDRSERISRRELLTKWFRARPHFEKSTEVSPTREINFDYTLPRRRFLKFIAALGATAAISHYLGKDTEAQKSQTTVSSAQTQRAFSEGEVGKKSEGHQETEQEKEAKPSHIETALQSALFLASEFVSIPIMKALKIPIGTARSRTTEKWVIEKPITALIVAGGLAPPIEEALFRLVPSKFIAGKSKSNRWDIGIPTSAIFALIHQAGGDEPEEEKKFLCINLSAGFSSGT